MKKLTDLSQVDVKNLDKDKCTVIIPIASIEQHGYHLPVSTDLLIMEGMLNRKDGLQRAKTDKELIALPIIPFGLSPEHMGYPGTITLSPTTIISLIDDITGSMIESGFKDFIVLNSHGGNTSILHILARNMRTKYKCTFRHIDIFGDLFFEQKKKILEGSFLDIHGGESETSLIMYLNPDLVNMNYEASQLKAEIETLPNVWLTYDLSQTGVVGDATLATKEKGEKLFCYMVERLAELI